VSLAVVEDRSSRVTSTARDRTHSEAKSGRSPNPDIGFHEVNTQIETMTGSFSRRSFLKLSGAGLAIMSSNTALGAVAPGVSPALLRRARAAMLEHRTRISHYDRMGIVDFSLPSCVPRLFVVDLKTCHIDRYLVAHGRGSDPAHTGWLQRFSNDLGSLASSQGAFLTSGTYNGAHGHSMRLAGLDRANSNADLRAIVIHAAPYVSAQLARDTGVLGRSEGCFAVAPTSRDEILNKLGPGRLLYAARV
jgi:hypothetical protein